jgi:hypothetical protein
MFRPSCPSLRIRTSRRDIGPKDPALDLCLLRNFISLPVAFLWEPPRQLYLSTLCPEGKPLFPSDFLFFVYCWLRFKQVQRSSICLISVPRL